jgi:hypothetical protein
LCSFNRKLSAQLIWQRFTTIEYYPSVNRSVRPPATKIKPEITSEISSEIKPEIKPEIRAEISSETSDQLRDQLRDQPKHMELSKRERCDHKVG